MNMRMLAMTTSFVALSFTGCALTTDRIELQYQQQQGVTQIPGANNISVAIKISDLRQDKSKVSNKKNGYGMEMAPILATEDVTVTVQSAIEQELRARGFQLDADAARVQIAAGLARFYSDHKMGFFAGDAIADLNISVTVKSKNGDSLYSRQIVAQGIEPNTQLASGENARLALNRALENGMRMLFEDQAFLAALMVMP